MARLVLLHVTLVYVLSLLSYGAVLAQTPTEPSNTSSQTTPDVNATEEFTSSPTDGSTVDTPGTTPPSAVTDAPAVLPLDEHGCLCDLTSGFCDIGCCCDTEDCGVANLSTVFTGCPQKAKSGVCVEKWLMFRANVDSSHVSVTDSLFCVQPAVKSVSIREASPTNPALGLSYHFDPPEQMANTFTRDFYRVDDVILAYYPLTSSRGLLRQPSPGAASALCNNRNPAKFLRSSTFSCSRVISAQSCITDPALNARSYIHDLNLIKHPILPTDPVTDLLIPVMPSSNWTAPSERNNSCLNVVKRVNVVIGYTERGEISSANVDIVVVNVDLEQLLLQTHAVQFQLITQTPPAPRALTAAVGLKPGSLVFGRHFEDVKPLTVVGVSHTGECSDTHARKSILFGHNSISGCSFTSTAQNCSDLRTEMYNIHRGAAIPDSVAMNSGAEPDWTRVIAEECLVSPQESCDTGCTLPHSLSVRVLWARQGLLELPHAYILGVKYVFHCGVFKCPLTEALALSNQVTFVDTTLHPDLPRGEPQLHWRFPFGFFTRGIAEVDGHGSFS
ncbi:unnamed protein product [Knipowitschia caucasica]|uniref:Tectonic domain-containing protein n=1 Tax=Knipowitschia caucasica TaxID=637954 RepID=A0AAV2LJ64_KNICA